ncbi:MAG: hypothetical protein ACFWUE_03670 [Xylanivirga thermophila]|jgi:hypothetical protein|uniref:hypothetical protein n=1 Tax=Xylanivirga thermophila TaxID=2496273 RepID=UPI00101C2286|nr:hypothetical protein [Xylanivirga thermophila]
MYNVFDEKIKYNEVLAMDNSNCNTGTRKFEHLNSYERGIICALLNEGKIFCSFLQKVLAKNMPACFYLVVSILSLFCSLSLDNYI